MAKNGHNQHGNRITFIETSRPVEASELPYGAFIEALMRTADSGLAIETKEICGTYYDTLMRRGLRLRRAKTKSGYAYWCEREKGGDWRWRSRAGRRS